MWCKFIKLVAESFWWWIYAGFSFIFYCKKRVNIKCCESCSLNFAVDRLVNFIYAKTRPWKQELPGRTHQAYFLIPDFQSYKFYIINLYLGNVTLLIISKTQFSSWVIVPYTCLDGHTVKTYWSQNFSVASNCSSVTNSCYF